MSIEVVGTVFLTVVLGAVFTKPVERLTTAVLDWLSDWLKKRKKK